MADEKEIQEEQLPGQINLFEELGIEENWKEHWRNMPEFNQEDLQPMMSIIVHFDSQKARDEFAKLIDQKITYKTKSVWYPKADIGIVSNKNYING